MSGPPGGGCVTYRRWTQTPGAPTMTTQQFRQVTTHLRHCLDVADLGALPDAELLARFRDHRDRAALEAIVRRHGPRVLAACRGVLRDRADAEDAFQATFVILLRSEEHTSELQSLRHLVCRLLLE